VEKPSGRLSPAKVQKIDAPLVAVSLGHGITDWYPSALYVALPYLAKDLGLTYSQVGVLIGWKWFASFFINLPGGMVVDMMGKTELILGLALALIGLPYLFLGFSTSYLVAIVAASFIGIGSNLWHPAALSFLAKRYPERRGFAISIHAMGGHIGNSLAPLVIGVALTFLTWRYVLMLSLLPGILMGLVLWRLLVKTGAGGTLRDEAKPRELSLREYGRAVKAMARNKSILLLCSLAGMRSMTTVGLFTFLPIYLAHELKYPPALVGVYISVVQFAGILVSPISGVVSDRKGRRPVLTAGLLVTSLLLVALVVLKAKFLFIGILAFLGFFLFSLQPVILAWMMDMAPKNVSGATVSALFGTQSLFSGFAPPICGFIADRFGLLYSFYFLAFTVFAANFVVYLIPDKPAKEETALAPQV
jgi:MFS transporter, FSR family, fosmidomycin resistance protein